VKLTVYNIMGEEIETIVNGFMKAGSYKVYWDASGYPSGAYILQVKNREFTEAKKMVLIK